MENANGQFPPGEDLFPPKLFYIYHSLKIKELSRIAGETLGFFKILERGDVSGRRAMAAYGYFEYKKSRQLNRF